MAGYFTTVFDSGDAKEALEYIRKESLDIYNRLHSIDEDIHFVNLVHRHVSKHNLPLLPNLRCGAWYTDPIIAYDAPAYFKSTDGHFNNWSFNLRRANLHLLPLIARFGGIALVDSTRSGKRMPDALSKTIPIWCAVINRALLHRFPDLAEPWNVELYTPPHVVSSQEHSAIEAWLEEWSLALAKSSYTLSKLARPLRPLWITPSNSTFPSIPPAELRSFCPVICVSASKQIGDAIERRGGGFSYVQGSGDDHELWGMGLTPSIFWEHRRRLLDSSRLDLPGLVQSLVSSGSNKSKKSLPSPIHRVDGLLSICAIADLPIDPDKNTSTMDYLIVTSAEAEGNEESTSEIGSVTRRLHLAEGKKGQYEFLQDVLPKATRFIGQRLLAEGRRVCIACHSGKDASIGIALAALQLYFDNSGDIIQDGSTPNKFDKQTIRTRLEWIISSRPQANPSRATLKRVNEYLLTPEAFSRGCPTK